MENILSTIAGAPNSGEFRYLAVVGVQKREFACHVWQCHT